MEDNANMFEALFEKATDYGKTSLELTKLKSIDKATDVASAFIPKSIVIVLALFCLASLSIGVSLYLGEMLGKIYYGFFVVAGFYALAGITIFFFLNDWLKKIMKNHLIQLIIKE
jgi:hypothetical protein